jgi:hypothetical protein
MAAPSSDLTVSGCSSFTFALLRLAPERSAPLKLVSVRLRVGSSAPLKLASLRSIPLKVGNLRMPWRLGVSGDYPSPAMVSSLEVGTYIMAPLRSAPEK